MPEVEIKKRGAGKIAYIEHVGDYKNVPWDEYIQQLYSWAKTNKVRPGFQPFGIYYDDPEKTSSEKCRSEIAISFAGAAKMVGEKIKVKDLPAMKVAEIKHKGPSEAFSETYRKVCDWIVQNGYEWAGPSIEVYTKKPKVVEGKRIIYARVQVPIKKK